MKLKINELINKSETILNKKSDTIEEEYIVFEELETLEEDCEEIIEQVEDEQIYESEHPGIFEESSKNEMIEVDFDENFEVLESFCCEVCSYIFNDQNSPEIDKHLKGHMNGKNICCMNCSELFSSIKSMKNHQLLFHIENGLNSCKRCKSLFETPELLKNHEQNSCTEKKTKKSFVCYICKSKFQLTKSSTHSSHLKFIFSYYRDILKRN